MTTKKILLIVGGIVVTLGFIIALFVGGVAWFAFSAIGNSEAAKTAKTYLRANEKLKHDIGEVRDFGYFITGNINSHNADGDATLNLKIIGEKKSVPASVNLAYKDGRDWRVVGASYRNDAGQTVELLEKYEPDAEGGGSDESDADAAGDDSKYSLDSRELEPALDKLASDYEKRVGLVRYHVDEQPATLSRFKIEKMPTLLLYQNGREQKRLTGAVKQQELARLLDRSLEEE